MAEHPPEGWHPDPTQRYGLRWWDGAQWTDHVHHEGETFLDPLQEAIAASRATQEQSASTAGGAGASDAGAAAASDDTAFQPREAHLPAYSGETADGEAAVAPQADGPTADDGGYVDDGPTRLLDVSGGTPLVTPGGDTGPVEGEATTGHLPEDSGTDDGSTGGDTTDGGTTATSGTASDAGAVASAEDDDDVATPAAGEAEASAAPAEAVAPGGDEDPSPTTSDGADADGDEMAATAAVAAAVPTADAADRADGEDGGAAGAHPSAVTPRLVSSLLDGGSDLRHGGDVQVQASNLLSVRLRAATGATVRRSSVVLRQGDVALGEEQGGAFAEVTGRGRLLLGDQGRRVHVVELHDDTVRVAGTALLAWSDGLEAVRVHGGAQRLSGSGWLALTTRGEPVAVDVDADTHVPRGALVLWTVEASEADGGDLTFAEAGRAVVQA